MGYNIPGFPAFHYLLEFAQTYAHWVNVAIQPSHPLSFPSPPALNLSQHKDLFQWVGSLHQVSKVLELQLRHLSFLWIFRVDWLVWAPCCSRDSRESSPAYSWKVSNLLCSALSVVQLSHPYMTTGKTIALTIQTFVSKVMSLLFKMLSRFVIEF